MRLKLNSNSQYFAISNFFFQPEEIVLILVHGERVLSENRLERKRKGDQRKQ